MARQSLEHARKWGLIARCPAIDATPPSQRRKEVVPPTVDQVWTLLEAARAEDSAFVTYLWVLAATGCRRGEGCALRWTDIDLDRGEVVIRRSMSQVGSVIREKETKTHQERRPAQREWPSEDNFDRLVWLDGAGLASGDAVDHRPAVAIGDGYRLAIHSDLALRRSRRAVELADALSSARITDDNGVPTHLTLADATSDAVEAVGRLFSVLDQNRPRFVQGTTLAKVLHRKRPLLVPLFDENVRRVYLDLPDSPVPRARNRSWEEFFILLVSAMRDDLRAAPTAWESLASIVPEGDLTALRALDIVVWSIGGARRPGGPGATEETPSATR